MAIFQRILLTTLTSLMLVSCVQVKRAPVSGDTTYSSAPSASGVRASTCASNARLGAKHDAVIRRNTFDPALFDAAVLHFTNQRRCALGLSPLTADPALLAAANAHSADMVRMKFFSHTSPVSGRERLTDRLDKSGASYRQAAENLGTRSRLKLESGRPFTIRDRATCKFDYDGVPVGTHSYRSLARQFVDVWEGSPEHRKNLLNPDYTRLGTGGSYKPNAKNCGDIVATQNFAA